MQYLITFLEGIISFISPCMLPLLPVYISFFAGEMGSRKNAVIRSLAFVAGFTVVFCLLGLFAGTLGGVLGKYKTVVNILCGAVVIIFGLSYLGVIKLDIFKGNMKTAQVDNLLSAFIFGSIYSISLTPCVGAFLGSALMLAGTSGSAAQGVLLLFVYSMGLGVPFLLSAVLIDKLEGTFKFIKKNYKTINTICGIFLIIVGIAMALGLMGKLMAIS